MIINIISLYCSCKRHWRHWRHCWRHWSEAGNGLHRPGCNLPLPPFLNATDKNIKKWLIFIKIKYIRLRGSVRLGSGLSPGRCNFSRFLESGFPWPNIFQLLYHNVVREDFTKKNHLITCFKRFYRCPTSLGSVHTYDRVSWCRNIIKSFHYSLRIFVCYAN